jgi:hypothetical protein
MILKEIGDCDGAGIRDDVTSQVELVDHVFVS